MVSVSRFEVILCGSDVCFGCVVVFTCDGHSIFFARPKTGEKFRFYKEFLTEVASFPIAFKTTIVVMINLILLCNFETGRCKHL